MANRSCRLMDCDQVDVARLIGWVECASPHRLSPTPSVPGFVARHRAFGASCRPRVWAAVMRRPPSATGSAITVSRVDLGAGVGCVQASIRAGRPVFGPAWGRTTLPEGRIAVSRAWRRVASLSWPGASGNGAMRSCAPSGTHRNRPAATARTLRAVRSPSRSTEEQPSPGRATREAE